MDLFAGSFRFLYKRPYNADLEVPGLQIQGIYITFQPERKPQSNNSQQHIAAQGPQMMPRQSFFFHPVIFMGWEVSRV